jgi:hypothetical protein
MKLLLSRNAIHCLYIRYSYLLLLRFSIQRYLRQLFLMFHVDSSKVPAILILLINLNLDNFFVDVVALITLLTIVTMEGAMSSSIISSEMSGSTVSAVKIVWYFRHFINYKLRGTRVPRSVKAPIKIITGCEGPGSLARSRDPPKIYFSDQAT